MVNDTHNPAVPAPAGAPTPEHISATATIPKAIIPTTKTAFPISLAKFPKSGNSIWGSGLGTGKGDLIVPFGG